MNAQTETTRTDSAPSLLASPFDAPPDATRVHGFEHFPEAQATLEAGLREGAFPGVVAGVWTALDPDRFHYAWGGARRLQLKGLSRQPMERDTIFDLASVTKVFGTAALAMALIERGWIRWDTPVRALIPDFKNERITLRMLAAHTSGLPAWSPFFEFVRDYFDGDDLDTIHVSDRQAAMREICASLDLERAPETKAVYSDVGFLLLGFALETATGLPLDQAVKRFVWTPMGLYEEAEKRGEAGPFYVRTTKAAFRARDERCAATEDSKWRGAILQGQVHDDNCWAMGGYGGHAGAFSTAGDLLAFGKKLLEGEFSEPTMREAWTRVAKPADCDRTPGWDTPSGEVPAFGRLFSPRSIGHNGFTGTSIWIDPDQRTVVTLLTNRVHPSRDNNLQRPFRGRFHDALARDLGNFG
jgi:CubicO group peptidase (beta-lactamase class C family)